MFVSKGRGKSGGGVLPLTAAIALLLVVLGGCGGGGDRHESGSAATLDDAYVYCYPLVMMSVSQRVATNVVEATSAKVPVNQLRQVSDLYAKNANFLVYSLSLDL